MARVKYSVDCVVCGRHSSTTLPKLLGRFMCVSCRRRAWNDKVNMI